MKSFIPILLAASIAVPAAAQVFGSALLMGLGSSALDKGSDMLKEAPEGFDRFMRDTEAGRNYASEAACLGELQVGINAGTLMTNMLPFSTVEAFEDRRGPVGRFRIMLNGEKHHFEVACDGRKMTTTTLPWGEAPDRDALADRSSLDAGAGLLLLLHIQGAFKEEEKISAAPTKKHIDESFDVEALIADIVRNSEEYALGKEISPCWNIGALSTEASKTIVEVALRFNADGTPIASSMRMVVSSGGSDSAAQQAFEAAKRAIIRCGARGYNLEAADISDDKLIILSFDPGRKGQAQGIVVK